MDAVGLFGSSSSLAVPKSGFKCSGRVLIYVNVVNIVISLII